MLFFKKTSNLILFIIRYQQVMVNCWNPDPKFRITFTTMKEYFQDQIQQTNNKTTKKNKPSSDGVNQESEF